MPVNKVLYHGSTLIDLTNDSVDSDSLLAGYTAHAKDGSIITGRLLSGGQESFEVKHILEDSSGNPIIDSMDNVVNGSVIYKRM